MKDKFSLAKSIYYIGMINFFGNYIESKNESDYKTIYLGDNLKITSRYKTYMADYYEGLLEIKKEASIEYVKGTIPSQKTFIDGIEVTIEKNGHLKGGIYIGKEQTLSPHTTLKEKREFMEYMLQKPKRSKADFVDIPIDNSFNLSKEDQKEIYYTAMDLIRWFDNQIEIENQPKIKKQ